VGLRRWVSQRSASDGIVVVILLPSEDENEEEDAILTSLGDEQRQFTTAQWATLIGGARLSIGGHLLLMVPNLEEMVKALFWIFAGGDGGRGGARGRRRGGSKWKVHDDGGKVCLSSLCPNLDVGFSIFCCVAVCHRNPKPAG